jgi:hypothetical protein
MKFGCARDKKYLKAGIVLACLGVLILFWGCGDYCLFEDCNSESGVTAVIEVTPSNSTTCQEVDLDGSKSTGANLTYSWSLTGQPVGSDLTLTSTEATASFTPLVSNTNDNTYTVQLKVTNDQAQEDTKTKDIKVAKLPYANPGQNKTVTPGTTVTLDGSGSKNPETGCTNSNLTYLWQVTAVVPLSAFYQFDDPRAVKPKFTTDPYSFTASYTIKLTVTTAGNLSAFNNVNVTTASQ